MHIQRASDGPVELAANQLICVNDNFKGQISLMQGEFDPNLHINVLT